MKGGGGGNLQCLSSCGDPISSLRGWGWGGGASVGFSFERIVSMVASIFQCFFLLL